MSIGIKPLQKATLQIGGGLPGIEPIGESTSRESWVIVTCSESFVGTSQSDENIDFICNRVPEVIIAIYKIFTLAPLYYLPTNRHSHRMSDDVHLWGFCVV